MNTDKQTTFAGLVVALSVFLFTWFGITLPEWVVNPIVLKSAGLVVAGGIAMLGHKANKP